MNFNPALETAAAKLLASLDRKAALHRGYRWRLLGFARFRSASIGPHLQ
ncbi:hypothetical protein [Microcoleus sp. AR_TQ3_B6]